MKVFYHPHASAVLDTVSQNVRDGVESKIGQLELWTKPDPLPEQVASIHSLAQGAY